MSWWSPADSWNPHELFLFNNTSSSRKSGDVVEAKGKRYRVRNYRLRTRLEHYNGILLRHATWVVAWMEPDIRLTREGFQHPHKREHQRARARMRRTILHETIVELHEAGISERAIADMTGAAKTTVHDLVAESDRAKLHLREKELSAIQEQTDRYTRLLDRLEESVKVLEERFPGDTKVSEAVDELLRSVGAEWQD